MDTENYVLNAVTLSLNLCSLLSFFILANMYRQQHNQNVLLKILISIGVGSKQLEFFI